MSAISTRLALGFAAPRESIFMRSTSMSTSDKVPYTAKTHTTGGREGESRSHDGRLEVKLSSPGAKGNGTNPEQLFAAAYSACFHASIAIAAGIEKVDITGSSVTAKVGIGKNRDGYGIVAHLTANLPGVDPATARTLVEKAHQICPYSRMTRDGINVQLDIEETRND
jgi:osmotically inducible protein OsmC